MNQGEDKIAIIEPNCRKIIRFEKSECFCIKPNCRKIPTI